MTESARFYTKWRGFASDSRIAFFLRSLLWLFVLLAITVPLMGLHR